MAGAQIHGVSTNRDLLVRVLRHPDFLAGRTETGFLHREERSELCAPLPARRLSVAMRSRPRWLLRPDAGWRLTFRLRCPLVGAILRYLHDPAERGLGGMARRSPMLLVGGDQAWGVLCADPMLKSRIYRRVHCRRLRPEQVLAAMPTFHPLYADVDPELLSFIDCHCGHGLFRNWASFTRTVLDVLDGARPLTKEAIANALTLLGGAHDGR